MGDRNHDGRLEWNNDEIMSFTRGIFHHYHIKLPTWPEGTWYKLYQAADKDHSYTLDMNESFEFTKMCFEQRFQQLEKNPEVEEQQYKELPRIDPNVKAKVKMVLSEWEQPGQLWQTGQTCFQQVDGDRNGYLDWNNDEVRQFVHALFTYYGLPFPP